VDNSTDNSALNNLHYCNITSNMAAYTNTINNNGNW